MSERVTLDESRNPALGELALNDDGVGSLRGTQQRPLQRRETDA